MCSPIKLTVRRLTRLPTPLTKLPIAWTFRSRTILISSRHISILEIYVLHFAISEGDNATTSRIVDYWGSFKYLLVKRTTSGYC